MIVLFDDPAIGIDSTQAEDIILVRVEEIQAHLKANLKDGDWDRIGVNVNRKTHIVSDTFVFRYSEDAALFRLFFG